MQSLEKGLQKQVADTSRRNASWGQKELALSADHVSLLALQTSFVSGSSIGTSAWFCAY